MPLLLSGGGGAVALAPPGFGRFNTTPSRDEMGQPMPAVDVHADRGPFVATDRARMRHASPEANDTAMQAFDQDLGELRRSRRVLLIYRKLVRDHTA